MRGGSSSDYLQFWREGVTLFTRVRQLAERRDTMRPDPIIEEFLGDARARGGRADEAFAHYQESYTRDSNGNPRHYNHMPEYPVAH